MAFPLYRQTDFMDCGPSCIRIIAAYYGKDYSLNYLRKIAGTTREGSSLLGLKSAAEAIGFQAKGLKITFDAINKEVQLPFIAHWNQTHFVVIYKIKNNIIYVSDPAHGRLKYKKEHFLLRWQSTPGEGILLELKPSSDFYSREKQKNEDTAINISFLFNYLFRYKKLLLQLFIGLIAGSLLQLVFPFLTQSIVDKGIRNHNLNFIYLVLLAQLVLFFGRISFEVIRSYILMYMSSRINISIVSDFFAKLMRLPISFFDVKMPGDIMQRINDHQRIESFLTSTTLNVLFSVISLFVFSFVLADYNPSIFFIFFTGSLLYFLWIVFFLKRRADLDYKKFTENALSQSKTIELIAGMQEIKLHNAEKQKRWQWEGIQVKLFKISVQGLALEQIQNIGSGLINELKNIFITFLSAKLVIDGNITLGMMLSISYIIGQLNSPVIQLVHFVQSLQDARLSLERLAEIHNKEDEGAALENTNTIFSNEDDLILHKASFHYPGESRNIVIDQLDLTIPAKKITAIVGSSGSGKTTLMKLLLKFYDPVSGSIHVGNSKLVQIPAHDWRKACGVVMQEGYIFSDTIAGNICIDEENIDQERLLQAVTAANIREHIESLPLGFNTKIGMEGIGLSTGQKQRILIARAVYKNPGYLFFDEATSALDSSNEKTIMNYLQQFFHGRTVVVIAHRLSTVKNADQIVVLGKGKILEKGTHFELVEKRGAYFELVKNQLELDNAE